MDSGTKEVVIPKSVIIPKDHRVRFEVDLPADYPAGASEVTLIFKTTAQLGTRSGSPAALSGKGKGKVWIAEDFDAPLADFKEYVNRHAKVIQYLPFRHGKLIHLV